MSSCKNFTNPDKVNFYQNVQKQKLEQNLIRMMGGSSQFRGFSKDEMQEILIDIPEEKERQEQMRQKNLGHEEFEQIKVGRTNELSSMMCLESLEQIKHRDRVNMQRDLIANIKAKKELAQNAIETGDIETATRMQLNQLKEHRSNTN